MITSFFSRAGVRIASGVIVVVLLVVVGRMVFREPQQLCVTSQEPNTSFALHDGTVTSWYTPVMVSVPMGRSAISITTPDGVTARGTLRVFDTLSPQLALDNSVVRDLVAIDFCAFITQGDTYAVDDHGTIAVYRNTTRGVEPTGFTLPPVERDGVFVPTHAVVSPNGIYVAYVSWDAALGATTLTVAEVSGKNAVTLASLTPEQGELSFDELSWSGSGTVAFAEITPMPNGTDADGNTRQKTLYHVNVASHAREGVHIDPLP